MLLGYANYYQVNNQFNAHVILPDYNASNVLDQFAKIITTQTLDKDEEIILSPYSFKMSFPDQMLTCYANIYIDQSPIAGRGVFAKKTFNKGDIVEVAPYIKDPLYKKGNSFDNYTHKSNYSGDSSLAVMGYGSLYNHHSNPNVQFYLYSSREYYYLGTQFMIYYATQKIKKNDELLIDYGERYWNK